MNALVQYLIETFLPEHTANKQIVVYAGRFQPFHAGHYESYQFLVKQFGVENVYIATSDKIDGIKSFFNFNEKHKIITSLFNVPSDKIVKIKDPYKPIEVFQKANVDINNTAYIAAVSKKDAERLKTGTGRYFEFYTPKTDLLSINEKGYVFIYPMAKFQLKGVDISASSIRAVLQSNKSEAFKRTFLASIYPVDNRDIFNFIIEKIQPVHENITESLNEGGGAGHMAHPFEDLKLTFAQLKNMIQQALAGKLKLAQEKLDGMNIMVTWKNGQLRAARNGGHLKNAGETTLDIKQLTDKFAGRGGVQTAFVEALNDLSKAIGSLEPQEIQDYFKEGKKFLNLEILYPETENVIPYGATQLNLHHFKEYDVDGKEIAQDHEGIQTLMKRLKDLKQDTQKTFAIKVADGTKFKAIADINKTQERFINAIVKLQTKYSLKDSDTLGKFIVIKWNNLVKDKCKNMGVELSSQLKNQLLARWIKKDKTVRINNIIKTVGNDAFKQWAMETDNNADKIQQDFTRPFEILFLKVGVTILKNIQTVTSVNPDATISAMQNSLQATIDRVNASQDEKGIETLQKQLKRLHDIGGMKAITPLEGIVFSFNNKLYKLTGAFAPLNQILNIRLSNEKQ